MVALSGQYAVAAGRDGFAGYPRVLVPAFTRIRVPAAVGADGQVFPCPFMAAQPLALQAFPQGRPFLEHGGGRILLVGVAGGKQGLGGGVRQLSLLSPLSGNRAPRRIRAISAWFSCKRATGCRRSPA